MKIRVKDRMIFLVTPNEETDIGFPIQNILDGPGELHAESCEALVHVRVGEDVYHWTPTGGWEKMVPHFPHDFIEHNGNKICTTCMLIEPSAHARKRERHSIKKLKGVAYLVAATVPWFLLLDGIHHLREIGQFLGVTVLFIGTLGCAVLGLQKLSGKQTEEN